jgi:hypothetical protein
MRNGTTVLGLIAALEKAQVVECTPQEKFEVICKSLNLKVFDLVVYPEIPEGSWMVEEKGNA